MFRGGYLIALKVLSHDQRGRPSDAADLHALIQSTKSADLEQARAAVSLITQRGFNRGRDLAALLERLIADEAESKPG